MGGVGEGFGLFRVRLGEDPALARPGARNRRLAR